MGETMGILFAFLTALVTAGFNIYIKKGMIETNGKSNGFLITILINVLIHSIIFLIVYIIKGFYLHFTWKSLIYFTLGGLFSTLIGRYALLSAIDYINPSRASILKNSTPLFTVFLGILLLDEKLNSLSLMGFVLILSAIFIQGFLNYKHSRLTNKEKGKFIWIGFLLGIFAAFIFGIGQIVRKQGLLITDEPFFGALVGSLIPLLILVLYHILKGNLKDIIFKNWESLNLNFIIASIFLSFGPLFFLLGSSYLQVSYVSVIAAVEPIMTILLSGILLKEHDKITFSVLITSFLIIIGTILIVLGV
jgi:drug/metabolite transporter (DMT)-like permease